MNRARHAVRQLTDSAIAIIGGVTLADYKPPPTALLCTLPERRRKYSYSNSAFEIKKRGQ